MSVAMAARPDSADRPAGNGVDPDPRAAASGASGALHGGSGGGVVPSDRPARGYCDVRDLFLPSALLVMAGGRPCAIPAGRVLQILSPVELMPVPHAPAHLLGKIAAQDDCLSVFDLDILVGGQAVRTGSGTRLVVVRILRQGWDGWHSLVLRVARVDGLVPCSGTAPGPGSGGDPLRGRADHPAGLRHDDREVPLLDLDWLLDIQRLASLAGGGGRSQP